MTCPASHSAVFIRFAQHTVHIFRHSLSVKEILEMPLNGQRVRSSDSHSCLCSPFPHFYTECALKGAGKPLTAFKGSWQNCPCNWADPPCLSGNPYPFHPWWSVLGLLISRRHTHLATPLLCLMFFILPESLLMTSSIWSINRHNSLTWSKSVPKLYLTSQHFTFLLFGYAENCKSCFKPPKAVWILREVNGRGHRCDLWIIWSQCHLS